MTLISFKVDVQLLHLLWVYYDTLFLDDDVQLLRQSLLWLTVTLLPTVFYDACFQDVDVQLLRQSISWRSFPWSWRTTVKTECIMAFVSMTLTFNCYVRVYNGARFYKVNVQILRKCVLWRLFSRRWSQIVTSKYIMALVSMKLKFNC